MTAKLTQADMDASTVRTMVPRKTEKLDLILSKRGQKLAEAKAWHAAKGEKHSEKSLRYYDAGFERGWMEAVKMVKEMGGIR